MKNIGHKESRIGNIFGATGGNYAGNVYDQEYLAPTLNTCEGGYRQPMIIVYNSDGNDEN